MTELLPDDERIVSLVEEIVSKGAKPSSATVIDWNVAFIADLLCQALNQHRARPARSADAVEVAKQIHIHCIGTENRTHAGKTFCCFHGLDENKAVALLEAFRQQIWAEAIEMAAKVAEWSHMVPPDGGSPSEAEFRVAEAAAKNIRSLTPLERKEQQ